MTFLFATPAYAQDPICNVSGPNDPGTSSYCQNSNGSKDDFTGNQGIFARAIDALTTVAAVASVFGIIIGGIMYTTSNGDASRATRARSTIVYSVVGLVVAIFAKVIVIFVLDKLIEGGTT
jgi:hypothetical protein